jgi:hypothetical protein
MTNYVRAISASRFIFVATYAIAMLIPASAQNWVQKFPLNSPTGQIYHTMAYDAAHGQVVLFTADSGQTWVWDGVNWAQKSPVNSPPARDSYAMAYDAAHREVVLFGGQTLTVLADTWVWDGYNWTQKSPTNRPPARLFATMAYDAAHGNVVLFGGGDGDHVIFGDTWVWDGNNWIQKSANSPGARSYHAMAYDAAREQVVLFGGLGNYGLASDTWVWDGNSWTQKSTANMPSERYLHAMAYDEAQGQMILFGGYHDDAFGNAVLADTWTWDGSNWAQKSPATSSPARLLHKMAYDAAHAQVVLFGGLDSNYAYLTDTWTWTATTTLQGIIGQIQALVNAGTLSQGQGAGLTAKLNAASHTPNITAACNQLGAFINQVNGFVPKTLTPAQGKALIDAANAVKDQNGCKP